jgi:hypothetical protein
MPELLVSSCVGFLYVFSCNQQIHVTGKSNSSAMAHNGQFTAVTLCWRLTVITCKIHGPQCALLSATLLALRGNFDLGEGTDGPTESTEMQFSGVECVKGG